MANEKEIEVKVVKRCVTTKGVFDPGDKVKLPVGEVARLGHCVEKVK